MRKPKKRKKRLMSEIRIRLGIRSLGYGLQELLLGLQDILGLIG
jgi:hypothetical protein